MNKKNNSTSADSRSEYIEKNLIPEDEVPTRHSLFYSFFVFIFLMFIFCVSIFHFVSADSEYSESENRVLAAMPKISWNSVVDGSFMSDFETYLADQFPFRDTIISAKTFCDRILGKNKENGVYIGKDGFLFDTQTTFSEAKADEIAKSINSFIKKYNFKNNAVIIAPNSSCVYSEYLPEYLQVPSQKEMLSYISSCINEGITFLDTCEILRESAKENKNLYYKTDHHWTTEGAYTVFGALSDAWSLKSENVNYEFYTASTTFEGTLASKAGVHDYTDEIVICTPEISQVAYVVNLESEGIKTGSFFFEEKLSQKNQYEVFLGGNYDKVSISTTADNFNNLLVIKDSYANCFIPMLTPYFTKIVVVDPRYLTDSLDSIISENSFTHVLFLYNLNTILQDTSMTQCLES